MTPDVHKYPAGEALKQLGLYFVVMGLLWAGAEAVQKGRPNPAASREYSFPDFAGNEALKE
jgi:hypothetical protein